MVVKSSEPQNEGVNRARTLRSVLIATTIAGVSLPHLVAGEVAGSLPSLLIGLLVGLGSLRLAFVGRSGGSRVLGVLGVAAAALAPLLGYFAQEAAEHEAGLEATHAEPSLLAAIATQAPLIILALIAVRLLVAVVSAAVRVLIHRTAQPRSVRLPSVPTPFLGALLPVRVALISSNGQRAPPVTRVPHRLAPLD
jgi:hypothetical protein